jgi:hypothetical protein
VAKKVDRTVAAWLSDGEFSDTDEIGTWDDILYEAGQKLDAACTGEILGTNLFVGGDGVLRTVTVEAVISRANPKWAKQEVVDQMEELGWTRGSDKPPAGLGKEDKKRFALLKKVYDELA